MIRKKGYSTKIFIIVLSVLIALLLIIFLWKWMSQIESKQREAQYIKLDEKIKSEVTKVEISIHTRRTTWPKKS